MGKGNAAVKQWMSNRARFADLFNGIIFQGKQVILPEELEPTETESDILLEGKDGSIKSVQRHRDIVMNWKNGIRLVVLACENQARIHYAMPVRNMVYDGLSYTEQIKKMQKPGNHKPEQKMTRDEFLSGFCKGDRLNPVITLVLYYGEELWDGSLDLYGMLYGEELLRMNPVLQQYVPNYKINLVEPGNMESLEMFCTDLHEIFGMLKYRKDKKELVNYVNERETYFGNVDRDTYYVIREFLHSERVLKEIDKKAREEKVDMCKALQDLYDEGVEKGIKQGIEQGIEAVARKLIGVLDIETIAEKTGLPLEVIKKMCEEQ